MKKLFFAIQKSGFTLVCLLSGASLMAQQTQDDTQQKKDWTDGELEDVRIEIVNEREITLPRANRNFEKIPPRPSEPAQTPLTYNFRTFSFEAPEVEPRLRPLKLKQQSSDQQYNNYLSLGYGNYASPYAEAFINSGKDKNKLIGAHGWLLQSAKGPVDGRNSGSGTAGLSLYGKTFGKTLSASGNIGYEHNNTHFYGYAPGTEVDHEDIRQAYNIFSLGGALSNTKNTNFGYTLGGDFSYLSDKFDAKETEVDLLLHTNYKIDDETSFKINLDYAIISRSDSAVDADPRNLLSVNAAYVFMPQDGFTMHAGVRVDYENDTLGTKDLHVYPDLEARYKVTPSVDVYGALTGGIDKVSLHSLSRENQWIGPNIPIYHTNRTFEFQVGMHARVGKKVEAQAGISAANLKYLYYFLNDTLDQSKFNVVYDDGGTKRSNLYASLSYAQSQRARFMFRGDVYTYTPSKQAEAWHRPRYRVSADAFYNVYDKILLKGSFIWQGGMKARDPNTEEIVTLDAAFDLNARVEYLFSDSFSFFAEFHNLISQQYPLYLNYPARGLQARGGITWSF